MRIRLPELFKVDSIYFNKLAGIPYKKRLEVVLNLANTKDKTILDVGFGYGQLLFLLSEDIKRMMYGINISSSQTRKTREIFKKLKVKGKYMLSVQDVRKTSFQDNMFDIVYALDVLEHIKDIDNALKEIKRILKPEGVLVASVPEENFIYRLSRRIVGYKKPKDHYHVGKFLERKISKRFKIEKRRFIFIFFPIFRIIKAKN